MGVDRDRCIQEIRERHAASTPGEWYPNRDGSFHDVRIHDDDPSTLVDGMVAGLMEATDAEFIAHAHQDVPWLLAEIERLESQLDAAMEPGS